MTGGTIYYSGTPVTVNSVASHTFTASKDTYIDIDKNGNIAYQAVTNNAASPSITANSIRVAIVITGASAIGFINIGQTDTTLSGFAPIASSVSYCVQDSLGNLIYPTDPQMRILGYREITSNASFTTIAQIAGLSCPVIVPSGRKVEITCFINVTAATTSDVATISIWDGVVNSGTELSLGRTRAAATNAIETLNIQAFVLPSSSSKTYNGGAANSADTGTIEASSAERAFIIVKLS